MSEKKVKVLLSAYNGERYIEEQVDSILQQKYQNIEVYIRDDGSKDNTLQVLKKYEGEGRVHVIAGDNVGFIRSFFLLVEACGDADFFAFADQDDVWLPEKVEWGVSAISRCSAHEPVLYFSHYDFYDKDMNFLSHSAFEWKKTPMSFRNALVDVNILGMTMLFNERLRQLMVRCDESEPASHDWWAYLVAAGCGRIVEDTRVTVKYRRHGDNSSGVGDNALRRLLFRVNRFLLHDSLKEVRRQINAFSRVFSASLRKEDLKLLSLFLPGHRIRKAVMKIGYPGKWRLTVIDDVQCRLMFLLGRL